MTVLAAVQLLAILTLTGVLIWHVLHTAGTHREALMQLLAAQDIERQAHRGQLIALAQEHAQERQAAHPDLTELISLVDRLCQRVQAPEQAVLEHTLSDLPESPTPVNPEDDQSYWDAQITALDKDQLADQAMEAELSG